MPLTVSEIAERIKKPGDDKARIVERVRHWTRENLLTPIGEKNPGTGQLRLYDESAVEDAAVLNELAEFGVQLKVQRFTINYLQTDKAKNWRKTAKKGHSLYLEMLKRPDGKVLPLLHEGDIRMVPQGEVSIVINLIELFKRVTNWGE
jgi:DNA-binding transcriptional MerR regulator